MAQVGPLKGTRVPVKLPWKSVATEEEQFVSMKKPVAEYLSLDQANEKDLIYQGEIRYKERNEDGEPVGGFKTKKVKRIRRPGYRERSLKLIFGDRKTGETKSVKVGKQSRKSISFPITKSVNMAEIVIEFRTGKYRGLDVIRVVDVNSGQSYPTI